MIQSPGFLWSVLFFLLALGPLIFLHELGHYLVGRWCGVKADVFAIGFGREVAGWTDKRGTRWKVGWMPLGGYVRFAGDENAASTPGESWKSMPDAERDLTFQSKPLWKRALIVAAGPVANFIVGFLIFCGIIAADGEVRIPATVGSVVAGSVADRAGFKAGDRIVTVGDREVSGFEELYGIVYARPKVMLDFGVERGGTTLHILAAPAYLETKDGFGNIQRRGSMGIGPPKPERAEMSLAEVPVAALSRTVGAVRATLDGLGQIIFGNLSVKEMSGPVKMGQFAGQIATLGWIPFLGFVALVSINLGFINLLPIPILDGGHLFFYAVEAVIRRPVPPEAQEWAFRSGFFALMALMLFVTFNDFGSVGVWQRLSGLIG